MYKKEIYALENHKKSKALIYDYSVNDEGIFDLLESLKGETSPHFIQRAFWVILEFFRTKNPSFLTQKKLFELVEINPSMQRNVVKVWQHCDLDSSFDLEIVEKCFEYISKPGYAIAVKAFSMAKLTSLAYRHPELSPEIYVSIEDLLTKQSKNPGILNRGLKSLKTLKSIIAASKIE